VMDTRVANLTGAIDSRLVNLEHSIDIRASGISGIMDERVTRITGILDDRTAVLNSEFATRASRLSDELDQRTTGLLGGLDKRAQFINAKVEERTLEFNQGFEQRAATLLGGMDHRAKSVTTALEQQSTDLKEDFDRRSADLINGLDQRAAALTGALDERSGRMIRGLDERSTGLLIGLDQRANSLAGAIDERSGKIIRGVDDKTGAFINNLDQRAALLTNVVEEKSKALIAEISAQTQMTGDAIDRKAERLSQILTERAAAINSTLGTGLLDTQRNLEIRTGELNRVLSERARELNEILENQAKPVVEAITTRGNDVSVRLGALHKTVATDIVELLSQLGGTSEALQKLLDVAGTRMSTMQETITAQARDLTQTVDKANRDVGQSAQIAQTAQQKMDSTAGGLITTISSIAERFEEQGLMLQHATRLIDAAQANFSTTLEDKQEALHKLASGLVERTETIERTMNAFGEMMRKTLDEVTEKSRGVGSIVSTEVGAAIDQANMRFAKSVEVMRQAASDVQRDLESTREQLRRGVLELPDETRESAESMRQVVSEQISALRELSEIVARSSKALEPIPLPTRGQSGGGQPSGGGFGGGFGRSRTAAAPEQVVTALPQPQQIRRMEPQEARVVAAATSPRPARVEPAARSEQPSPAPRGSTVRSAARQPVEAETAAQGGWVGDLMRRASREEEFPASAPASAMSGAGEQRQAAAQPQRTANQVVDSLNSLSMDIARAIDHDAFIDLWNRYQRGESNVFTRRLYTLQGEQTFEEISAKYAREPEFRAAVDRYIADFEKLLSDVSRNDRDRTMTQTYLTSDTGKVYTLLAHAAGRFAA
jgi:hypothetical protein